MCGFFVCFFQLSLLAETGSPVVSFDEHRPLILVKPIVSFFLVCTFHVLLIDNCI